MIEGVSAARTAGRRVYSLHLCIIVSGAGVTQARREGSRLMVGSGDESESSMLISEGTVVYRKKMGRDR